MELGGMDTVLVVGADSLIRQPLLTKEILGNDVLLGFTHGLFSF